MEKRYGNITVNVNEELLDRLLIHGKNEKTIRKIAASVLKEVQKHISEEAKSMLKGRDNREAYKAVKYSVYRRILGGNVSILNRKKAGARGSVKPSSRVRSRRTENLLSYQGRDLGFVLRFLNSGTQDRVVSRMNNHEIKMSSTAERSKERKYKSGAIGFRGNIKARNWFPDVANRQMEIAAQKLSDLINAEIAKQFNNGK